MFSYDTLLVTCYVTALRSPGPPVRLPAFFTCLPVSLQVELVYYVFGRHKFPGAITANLERFVRRFNEVQHWVVTELCLCEDLVKRAILLKKFIKIAAV